jgi:hypothetical protein
MRTLIILTPVALTLALVGCADLPQSDRGPEMGQVEYAGESWPIYAWPNGNWRVLYDGQTVRCTEPTAESCYWSLRHYVNTQIDFLDR